MQLKMFDERDGQIEGLKKQLRTWKDECFRLRLKVAELEELLKATGREVNQDNKDT